MSNSKIFVIFLLSITLLVLGVGLVQGKGLCEPCAGPTECNQGLACKKGKCQVDCTGQICIENPLTACNVQDILDSVTNVIFWLGMIITPLMILIAGFNLVTAAGDTRKIDVAKRIITSTAIGLAIILFAKGLVSVIKTIIGY